MAGKQNLLLQLSGLESLSAQASFVASLIILVFSMSMEIDSMAGSSQQT